MFRSLLRQSALQLPPLKRIKAELDELRSSRVDNNRLIDGIRAERDALQNQLYKIQAMTANKPRPENKAPINDNATARSWAACFTDELVDLSLTEPKYRGVVSPKPEIGLPKIGITETLLSGAEDYFKKYQQFSYIFNLVHTQLEYLDLTPRGIAIDFGSGFGNTVIPLLENYPDLKIIATDLSPDLLAILKREADKRGIGERCIAVAMDSQRNYFQPESVDVVFGCAVLHHLINPEDAVRAALHALKPGGFAIFLEPFENGHSILRMAYNEILEEAARRGESGPGFDFLRGIYWDISVRAHRGNCRGWNGSWKDLDDKWLFTRDFFDRLRLSVGASDLQIRPLHSPDHPFGHQAATSLASYAGLKCPDALPQWAWDILKRYDEEMFSLEMRRDLVIEGAVIITK